MVGILINHDLVRIPEPVVAESNVVRGNAKVEATEPETIWIPTSQPPNMAAAEAALKALMFPRMIEMVVRIVRTGVMANPLVVGVHMWLRRCVPSKRLK